MYKGSSQQSSAAVIIRLRTLLNVGSVTESVRFVYCYMFIKIKYRNIFYKSIFGNKLGLG